MRNPLALSALAIAAHAASTVSHGSQLDEGEALFQREVHVNYLWQPAGNNYPERLRDQLGRWSPSPTPAPAPSTWHEWHPSLKAMAMEKNKPKDYELLGLAFITNFLALLACFLFFRIASSYYPEVYANNARSMDESPPGLNTAPFLPEEGAFGWATAALALTQDQMKASVGVDMMMAVEFSNFALRLMVLLGVPLLAVLVPVHYWAGSDWVNGEKVDVLSKVGIGHIQFGSQIFWVHIVATWYVVLMTENQVNRAMHRFLEIRVHWLLDLQPPRSTTVLVEGIPENRQSEAEMKDYFEMLFPGCIESVYIVKRTNRLKRIQKRIDSLSMFLENANHEWDMKDKDPLQRPTIEPRWFQRCCGSSHKSTDKIQYYEEQIAKWEEEAEKERLRILSESAEPMIEEKDWAGNIISKTPTEKARAVNSHTGFVTFTSEREARLMLGMRCTASFEEWISYVPPDAQDIIYEDLQGTVSSMKLSHLVGYACVAAVFFSFLPLICTVGSMNSMQFFDRHFPKQLQEEAAIFFEGVVAQMTLTLFTSFLPTTLMLVLKTFFVLRAHAWAQLKLQVWLFWFNLIFVVLVTSLEGSLLQTFQNILVSPQTVMKALARNLPWFTHFYLNWMCMQWVVHSLNLTRYIQLLKYHVWRYWTGSWDHALTLTEPEDQDYYGIGNRSAQWTINLIIGIVFCTICPLITIFTFVTFVITRVVYGYLIVFAETKKPDLGGPFFVTQLWHVQYGMLIYTVLMTGVIWDRSNKNIPMVVAIIPTIFYVVWGYYYFHTNYQWESLPFEELCTEEAKEDAMEEMVQYRALGENRPRYRQKELYPDPTTKPCTPVASETLSRFRAGKEGSSDSLPSSPSRRGTMMTAAQSRKHSDGLERTESSAGPSRAESSGMLSAARPNRLRRASVAAGLLGAVKMPSRQGGQLFDHLDQMGQHLIPWGAHKEDDGAEVGASPAPSPRPHRLELVQEPGSDSDRPDSDCFTPKHTWDVPQQLPVIPPTRTIPGSRAQVGRRSTGLPPTPPPSYQ